MFVIQRKNVEHIVKTIFNIPLLSYEVKQLLLNSVNNELKNVCRNKDPSAVDELQRESSILQDRDYNSLKGLTWEVVIKELQIRCPTTLDVISSLVDTSYSIEKKLPVVSLIYSLAALSRNPKMSRLQRINSMLLTEGNANSMVCFPVYTIQYHTNLQCFFGYWLCNIYVLLLYKCDSLGCSKKSSYF